MKRAFARLRGVVLKTLLSSLIFIGFAWCMDTSSSRQKWLDVPYANASPAEKLDIYLPDQGQGPFPVIVSIHGGAFIFGDKVGIDLEAAQAGLARGYAVVSINYRLSGEARFPAQIHDVKAAIRFIRAHAGQYGLNPDRIAVWGSSAGGHLAALAGTSGDAPELEDPGLGPSGISSRVQAVVDWFGPTDFLAMDGQFRQSGIAGQVHDTADSPESKLLGKKIGAAPDRVRMANPETYISACDPPFFIQHGTRDRLIPVQQSVEFARRLEKILGKEKVTFEALPGAGHGGPMFFSPANIKSVLDFLDRYLK